VLEKQIAQIESSLISETEVTVLSSFDDGKSDRDGTIDNIENFMESFGWQTFKFDGSELFGNLWILGLFGVILGTGLWVLLATIFNLITDLVGGVRVTVLEEEVRIVSVEADETAL